MNFVDFVLIGVGLGMDAMSVSICKGLSMKKMEWKKAVLIGMYFGVFQMLMPLIGFGLGSRFKQFLEQMPDTYLEAARLDGANEWQIYIKIVLPQIKSALATLVVFSFTSSWNDYLGPVIYLSSDALKTLPLAVQTISGGVGASSLATAGAMAASTLITVLPTIIVYTVMQGRVMNTMAHSGIKG